MSNRHWQEARTVYHLDLVSPRGTDKWVLEHGGCVRDFRPEVYIRAASAQRAVKLYARYCQHRGLDRRAVIREELEDACWVYELGTFSV